MAPKCRFLQKNLGCDFRCLNLTFCPETGKLLQVGGVVVGSKMDIILTVIDINNIENPIVKNYEACQTLRAPIVQHTSLMNVDKKKNEDCHKIVVFGGGTNCFSFGMHVNSDIIKISYS